jgi:hypothetical protein
MKIDFVMLCIVMYSVLYVAHFLACLCNAGFGFPLG